METNKTPILIGGTKEFTNKELLTKELTNILKKYKLAKKNILVFGYGDDVGKKGAHTLVEEWAKSNKVEFKSATIDSMRDFKNRLAKRNAYMADNVKLFINLRVGSLNGGSTIIRDVELKGTPIEVINEKVSDVALTPSQRRKGDVPDAEAVKQSIQIYSKVAQKLLEHRCLMIDTETTGLSKEDEVVEIAIGDCKTGTIIFNSLVKPTVPMNEGASKANGITDDMLKDAPDISEIWAQVEALVGNRVVLASHSTSETEWFDERVLNQSLIKHGLTCSFIWKDLQPLYRLYSCQVSAREYPLRTDGMCLQMGVESGTHRAKDDVIAQIRILQAMANGVVPNFEE